MIQSLKEIVKFAKYHKVKIAIDNVSIIFFIFLMIQVCLIAGDFQVL